MIKNELFQKIECSELSKIYSELFNENWYPDFFIQKEWSITYVDDLKDLSDIIIELTTVFEDENIYLKSFDYREYGFCCYSLSVINIDHLTNDEVFDNFLHSADEGALIFGDKGKWSLYIGEDLYDGKRDGNFYEFLFIFVNSNKNYVVKDFYEKIYDINIIIESDLKSRFFKTPVSEGKVDIISLNKYK